MQKIGTSGCEHERIAVRNVDALPRNIDPAELTWKLNYYSGLAPLSRS